MSNSIDDKLGDLNSILFDIKENQKKLIEQNNTLIEQNKAITTKFDEANLRMAINFHQNYTTHEMLANYFSSRDKKTMSTNQDFYYEILDKTVDFINEIEEEIEQLENTK